MAVHLFFADWAAVRSSGSDVVVEAGLERKVLDGTPILLDGLMRPVEPWCRFLRQYAVSVSELSMRAYARDALRFARFLDGRGVRVEDVTQDDLVAYRSTRRAVQIAESTWGRELVVIRALFAYLVKAGLRAGVPWIEVGRWSVVRPRLVHTEMQVRALTHEQWLAFKDVGVGGQRPDGGMDDSYRGHCTVRDTTAAELAITTGMRLQEWRSLLDVEVRADHGRGAELELQAAAKNQRLRTVYVPATTMGTVELYRATERRRSVLRAQPVLRARARRGELAVVDEIDVVARKVAYKFEGREYRLRYRQIPLNHRPVLAREVNGMWEPLSLWVGRAGAAPSQRGWHEKFARANRRLRSFDGDLPVMAAVTPHSLRHTFAVVLLRSLQRRALEYERHRRPVGTGTVSEHLVFNPLLTLQRLLGHASPATTLVYLRFVDDSMELVQRAFESWDDESKDYAEHVIELVGSGSCL